MTKDKKDNSGTFLFYDDFLDAMTDMSPEEVKNFMMAIRNHRLGLEVDMPEDRFMRRELNKALRLISEAEDNYKRKKETLKNNLSNRRSKSEEEPPVETIVVEEVVPKKPRSVFVKPTEDEVRGYMVELKGNSQFVIEQVTKFIDHYESNGWKVGKNSMKDWKAAIRNWFSNKNDYGQTSKPTTRYERTSMSEQQLAAAIARQCAEDISKAESSNGGNDKSGIIPLRL